MGSPRSLGAQGIWVLVGLSAALSAVWPTGSVLAQSTDRSEEVVLSTHTGEIHGTLLRPVSPYLPRSIALIIAGSGPTDRDGNSPLLVGANNSLRYLAESLSRIGIASLRYDKRGVAESMMAATSEADLRFMHYVDDAIEWIQWIDSHGEYDRVYVIGHSEGALVGTLAAERVPVDGLALLAGTGRPLGAVLREQLAAQLPAPLLSQADGILLQLEAGNPVAAVPPTFLSLFRPSVQPYLMGMLALDPPRELAFVTAPVLIVNGTTDIQVSAERDARVLAAAVPTAHLEIIPGMNHILKRVGGGIAEQTPAYSDPDLPVMPELIAVLEEFLTAPSSR